MSRQTMSCVTVLTVIMLGVIQCDGCFRAIKVNQPEIDDTRDDQAMFKMTVRNSWIIDKSGRVRLFHGINGVEKQFPWYPDYLLNDTQLQLYKDWGFNVVRLGAMWAGMEPSPGHFNETYISILQDIVLKLKQKGMYVILDMHQDILSSKFRTYDGVPLWLVDMLPPSPHPFPWPLPVKFLMWTDGYLTQACGRAFQGIYDNYNGTLDLMARFWSKVAAVFKDERFENVLGYELMNEPWAGDIYSKPSLLEPGVAGRTNLMPMYNKLNAAIRLQDPTSLLFYEPVTWGVFTNGKGAGTGFDTVPGGAAFVDRSVLSFHYYCWIMPQPEHQTYPFFQRVACDGLLGPSTFNAVSRDIRRTGGSYFLTEFGLCDPDSSNSSAATVECTFVMDQADQHLASWTYWDTYSFFYTNGSINHDLLKTFVRPYARTISGTPSVMKYDHKNKMFQLKYTGIQGVRSHTEIFVPTLQYPNGISASVTGTVSWAYNKTEQVLYINWLKDTNLNQSNVVGVTLMPN